MTDQTGFSMVLTTVDSEEKAEELAVTLIRENLCACVQISPIRSLYMWEENISRDNEFLLRIKSRSSLYPEIEKFLNDNHPYDLPQIIEVPIQGGLEEYLNWIGSNTLS